MKLHPPACSAQWTAAERLNYLGWLTRLSLSRIDADDADVPLLAKKPTRALWHAAHAVAMWPPERLEANREALMKPYDSSNDHHGVLVPKEWLDALRRLGAQVDDDDRATIH